MFNVLISQESENKDEYLDISGVQTFTYTSREILSGELANYYPYQNRFYSLDLNIKGKFETGASIEGYFKKSSRIDDNDYINIKVYDKHYETEFGNTDRLTESSFYSNNKIIAVKGKLFNDKHSLEGGFGTPEGKYHYQYIEGDNTQGPFQLDNIPVLSMTEKIYVVEDGVKEELMNGRDYTIDYRTGRITLNFILTDDNMLEAEYYSSSWTDLSRVDYVLGANSRAGLFTFGLNAGGVHFKEDSLTDTLSDYMNAGANAGFAYGDLININTQLMTSVNKDSSDYTFSGTGINADGSASYSIVSLNGNIYKSFGDFKRVGEINDRQYTTLGFTGTITPLEWVKLQTDYSKQLSDKTDTRQITGKGQVSNDKWGNLNYQYSDNYNYSYIDNRTQYYGHSMDYSNKTKKIQYTLGLSTGINNNLSDTLINQYRKSVLKAGLSADISENFGLSIDGKLKNKAYQDSSSNDYQINGNGHYKYRNIVNYSLSGNYMHTEGMNLYSGINNLKIKAGKYLDLGSKVKAEVNRRYSYSDSTEPEMKYSINNTVSSSPLSFLKLRYSNTMNLSQGIESRFMYRRNISNSGNISMSFKYFQINTEAGNGMFLNYSNTLPNELQSDNRRNYLNTNISLQEIEGYRTKIYGKYSSNSGLTMQYIEQSYFQEIDTVSNLVEQSDYTVGTDISRDYQFGRMTAGYSFIYNSKYMPDSIPVDAYSHQGFIEGSRTIIEGLDIDISVTGEKRQGTDPDIERTDEYMDVVIITPEAGIHYSLEGYGSAGVTYNTSFYTGTSEQVRHKLGSNININKSYFNIQANADYAVSEYYKTLEYKAGVSIRF